MFLDEARLSARLHHANVVETHEVAQEDGHTFMAMEYLEGQSLHRILHRLRRHGGLPKAMHLQILADMLAGLHHAHELADWDDTPLGVVHRDVTPQNVFITYDGMVKVVDFGIAKGAGRFVGDARWRREGEGRLHGPGAGAGPTRGSANRCLRRRGDALGGCDRGATVSRTVRRRGPPSLNPWRTPIGPNREPSRSRRPRGHRDPGDGSFT